MLEKKVVDMIKSRLGFNGRNAIILGSGLGTFANYLKNKLVFPYSEVTDFPRSTVTGHQGEFKGME